VLSYKNFITMCCSIPCGVLLAVKQLHFAMSLLGNGSTYVSINLQVQYDLICVKSTVKTQ